MLTVALIPFLFQATKNQTLDRGLGELSYPIYVCHMLVIWFLERGLNVARPNIRAHTSGPPATTLTWRTTHRYGLGRIEDRIAAQIEKGQPEAEPSGTVLIGI